MCRARRECWEWSERICTSEFGRLGLSGGSSVSAPFLYTLSERGREHENTLDHAGDRGWLGAFGGAPRNGSFLRSNKGGNAEGHRHRVPVAQPSLGFISGREAGERTERCV